VQPTGYVSEIFVSFQGEGLHAGRRHLFVRMAGCNLRCRYCDTPDSLERVPILKAFAGQAAREERNPVDIDRLDACIRGVLAASEGVDGTALTGGEPLLQAEFLAQLLSSSAPVPRPVLLETSGILPERLAVVLAQVDIVSMDIKLPSNTGEPASWAAHERFLRLARGKAYVKVLVDAETDSSEVETAARLVAGEADETPFFLQPITGPNGSVSMRGGDIDWFYEVARRHLADVRVLPQTHKMLRIR
jgi:7-carboxy-7-deazaguanine synthase